MEVIQLTTLDHLESLEKAAEVAFEVATKKAKVAPWNWVDQKEAMKMLNCKRTKLYKLRRDKKITGTPGTNGMFFVPSMNDYLLMESSK